MLAIISNINISPIEKNFKNKIYISGFNQYYQELIDPNSGIYDEKIDQVFLFLDGDELIKNITNIVLPTPEVISKIRKSFDSISDAIERFIISKPGTLFIVNDLVFNPSRVTTFLDLNSEISLDPVKSYFRVILGKLTSRYPNILILNWESIVEKYGWDNLHDDKYWYLGRIKFNNKAFTKLSEYYNLLLNTYKGVSKKVILLDLDNTLWGGITGELGPQGITLSEDGKGKIYRDFQVLLKNIKDLGVLLCIVSKNNEKDVFDVFHKNKMMILKYDDFILKKINWKSKVENIRDISSELNLSLNSFVLIDDNPSERSFVKMSYPEIETPDFPDDISNLPAWFIQRIAYPYFGKIRLTNEDKSKTEQYISKSKREILSKNISLTEFIGKLKIKLKLFKNDTNYIPRIAQLTQKTNQFNLTTRRYTDADINSLIDKGFSIYAMAYEDRFGKEGIIGVAITIIKNNELIVDSFLLSCRVIGKNVEYALLNYIINDVKNRKISKMIITYIRTPKNSTAFTFYKSLSMCKLNSKYYSISQINNLTSDKIKKSYITIYE
jgi:FkbH-like protein